MIKESSFSPLPDCGHCFVRHGICLTCKKKVNGLESRAFNYLFSGLRMSHKVVSFTKRLTTLISLHQHKKLHLVLDLDHTLIHSVKASNLSKAEKYLIENSSPRECLRKFYNWLVKLRPFLGEFLEEANKLFNMYVYTKASSCYAKAIMKMIDTNKIYFGDRVITKKESNNSKTLDLVLADERAIVVVDNSLNVWPHHKRNFLHITSYLYFKCHSLNKVSKSSLYAKKKRDESRCKGLLSNVLPVLKEVHNEFFSCDLQQ